MLILLVLALVPVLVSGQTFIEEGFNTWPPEGWSADSHPNNWHGADGDEAGGVAPEAVFDWSPKFSGTTHFMSPEFDLTGVI